DQRAGRDREAAKAAPDADDRATALHWEGGGQDREARRRQERRAGALHSAGCDQDLGGRGPRARGRGRREQDQTGDERQAAAVAVAEGGGGDDASRRGQAVGIHRPLQRGQRGPELVPHGRQRGHDDQQI